ncbi:hypothetical protein BC828DRAFT_372525 [Blastocladiella britannica]|nr:hypothetical protein BC828DRAFT_372525 [Blastocladiella britannica]
MADSAILTVQCTLRGMQALCRIPAGHTSIDFTFLTAHPPSTASLDPAAVRAPQRSKSKPHQIKLGPFSSSGKLELIEFASAEDATAVVEHVLCAIKRAGSSGSAPPRSATPTTASRREDGNGTAVTEKLGLSADPTIVQQVLPHLSATQELLARSKLMSIHRTLKKLHLDLVGGDHPVMSDYDFWLERAPLLEAMAANLFQQPGVRSALVAPRMHAPTESAAGGKGKRDVSGSGWGSGSAAAASSSASASAAAAAAGQEAPPEANMTRIALDHTAMMAFFVQFPGLEQLYHDRVPEEESSEEFWKKFLRSKLFHHARIGMETAPFAGAAPIDEPVFDKLLVQEEEKDRSEHEAMVKSIRSTLNLGLTEAARIEINGNQPDRMMRNESIDDLRRVNARSMRILRAASHSTATGGDRPPSPNLTSSMLAELVLDDLDIHTPVETMPLYLSAARAPAPAVPHQHTHRITLVAAAAYATRARDLVLTIGANVNAEACRRAAVVASRRAADGRGRAGSYVTGRADREGHSDETVAWSDLGIPPVIASDLEGLHAKARELLQHFWGATRTGNVEKEKRLRVALRDMLKQLSLWQTQHGLPSTAGIVDGVARVIERGIDGDRRLQM